MTATTTDPAALPVFGLAGLATQPGWALRLGTACVELWCVRRIRCSVILTGIGSKIVIIRTFG